jgi:alkylation response protein AidB-like acyl-CoA dehydrogenase
MDFDLTEEQSLVQLMARDFAREKIAPFAMKWDKEKYYPAEVIKQMGQLGFMGMMVPENYGGSGVGALTYCLVMQEIAYADAGVAVTMSVTNLSGEPVLRHGTEEQKKKFLLPIATGEKLGAFCLTEPGAGSDAGSINTRARKVGDEYVLNGSKLFITNGLHGDLFFVVGRTAEGGGNKGLSAFMVEKDAPGFSIGTVEDKMGLRSSSTTELIFEDCRVPVANRIGKEGEGFKVAMSALDSGRIGIASQAIGIARACLDEAREYAQNRRQFGRMLANFQAIQWKIADMATLIHSAHLMILYAAWLKDQGKRISSEASMAKLHATEGLIRSAYEAQQIFGGYGYMKDYKIEKLYRDARVTTIYEGTSEIQRLVIARETLKEK